MIGAESIILKKCIVSIKSSYESFKSDDFNTSKLIFTSSIANLSLDFLPYKDP